MLYFAIFISLLLGTIQLGFGIPTIDLGSKKPCAPEGGDPCVSVPFVIYMWYVWFIGGCEVDGYVGSNLIYEDDFVRVWNFTLAPGEVTTMHRHDYDYHFVAIKPTQLEVYSEQGEVLFDFRAEGVLGFKVNGDFLDPINVKLPFPVPRVHAAKNIGTDFYYEILYESKSALGHNFDSNTEL